MWAYDIEWAPDPEAIRPLIGCSDGMTNEEVVAAAYQRQRDMKSLQDERPYLHTPLCSIASMAVVVRTRAVDGNAVSVKLRSTLSRDCGESVLLKEFLGALAKTTPQLVGWNSSQADWWILVQRACRYGLSFPGLARPAKPWEGADYFDARNGSHQVDLKQCLGPMGRSSASLEEMAACFGIPCKVEASGEDVATLVAEGKHAEVLRYNEQDALTTFLVWLRAAHFVGLVKEPRQDYDQVLALVEDKPHLHCFREACRTTAP